MRIYKIELFEFNEFRGNNRLYRTSYKEDYVVDRFYMMAIKIFENGKIIKFCGC